MELIATVAGILGSIFILVYYYVNRKKVMIDLQRQRRKINACSTNMLEKADEKYNPPDSEFLYNLDNEINSELAAKSKTLESAFDHYDKLVTYCKTGVITREHLISIHGAVLEKLANSNTAMEIFNDFRDGSKYKYANLQALFVEIRT